MSRGRFFSVLVSLLLSFHSAHSKRPVLPSWLLAFRGGSSNPGVSEGVQKRFLAAAHALRTNGHPPECPALLEYEAAVATGAPEKEIIRAWLGVRIATCEPAKASPSHYEQALLMVAVETLAYLQKNKLSADGAQKTHELIAEKLGLDGEAFKSRLSAFEDSMAQQAKAMGATVMKSILSILRDPAFTSKAIASMRERKSRALDFLSDENTIEKTRAELLAALEAVENDPLQGGQLALKIKPSIEVMLGPIMGK